VCEVDREAAPKNPMVRSLLGCCARAAIGHTAAHPSAAMKPRRLTSWIDIEPPAGSAVPVRHTSMSDPVQGAS